MPLDIKNFLIEPSPIRESEGIVRLGQMANQNREWQYRHQKDIEQEDWRKLNLIQDATDLSKYQTGSDVADALGNQLAAGVLQKYTAAAKNMSGAELQAKINQEMSGLIGGMTAMKNELVNSHAQLQALKSQYPNLDVATLEQKVRADAVGRRLKNGMEFKNPVEVGLPGIDLTNPDTLSDYLKDTKKLDDAIRNPQGLDAKSVFVGNPNNYTKYTSKIPFFTEPSFSMGDVDERGFLKGNQRPMLKIRSADNQTVADDVAAQFMADHPLEVIAGTKKEFPEYTNPNLTDSQKELLVKKHLYNKIKSLNQINFEPTEQKTPSASMLKYYAGGGTGKEAEEAHINDIYKTIDEAADKANTGYIGKGKPYLQLNLLPLDAQQIVLDFANKATASSGALALGQADVKVRKGDDKRLGVYSADNDQFIGYLPKVGTNLKVQPSVKEKKAVVKEGETAPTKMTMVVLSDGRKGSIPEDQVETFLKENKGSKRQ